MTFVNKQNNAKYTKADEVCTIHCVQKKTPTHIFFHISMNYLWI